MPDIHELLDETKRHCDNLVGQIEALKQSKDLNNAATQSLESVCEALQKTSDSIKPFTENSFRQMKIILFSLVASNLGLTIVLLVLVLMKKSV